MRRNTVSKCPEGLDNDDEEDFYGDETDLA